MASQRWTMALVLAAMLAPALQEARADFTYYRGDVGGFVSNSATPAYLAAQGPPTEFINFETDKFGNTLPIQTPTAYSGDIFSNLVTFSSLASPTFGGVDSSDVLVGFVNGNAEIGPVSDFNGILAIDFLAAGGPVSAVGFGTVAFNSPGEVIRFYDQTNTLFATIDASDFHDFEFLGVIGASGSLIGRVELEGLFFAIQDIQFVSAVPEPTSLVTLSLGALALGALRLRSTRRPG